MKLKIFILFYLSVFSLFAQLPEGFVYVKDIIPDLDVELRYHTSYNFVGKPVNGYHSNKLILTLKAAQALKKVNDDLQMQNLCLKVFDGYRPQRAVDHFMSWARDMNDTLTKQIFYPHIKKKYLFQEQYIATHSGHSKGSTLDLTIIDGNTGEALDMGSPFDFFGPVSSYNNQEITEQQKANRKLLHDLMLNHGFRGYSKEWWHFTLRHEPFPNTYFDFPVE
ncbi:M15 family metallopeptidase [Tamlana sp. 2_MG-2023]|uniref:M15 family metallopeptidase n=1 Tax=unclassified Tamlana TaxID=2614803 RepID=UPI0026E397C8|nr:MULTISPECIES: M15 family metallopeptidase [unclassified Tamlana]MDO6760153.1 M15 family metallopeptidase [Tamlana sp. 2_MG-2023]MDO6790149.1 M15 family metallopeptidase [Tamlana sp. 1_MG-2023]